MNLSPVLRQRFFDASGAPLAGGQLYSYAAGTTTPQVTYSNQSGATNTNPVILDSNGYADVWLDPTLSYKFVLQDVNSNILWSVDSVAFPIGIAAWNANAVYSQGSIVMDSSGQGLLYVSLTSNNQNNALTNVSAWRVFAGNVRTVSSNATLNVTDDLVRSNSTSGSLTHTLPPCSTTPIGKRITIKDVGTTAGNTTTIKGSGTDNVDGANTYGTAISALSSLTFETNGTSWDVVHGAVIPNGSITQAKRAALPYVISSSSGLYTSNGYPATAVPALSVTMTTTGRPVRIALVPDNSYQSTGAESAMWPDTGGSVYLLKDGTIIDKVPLSSTPRTAGRVEWFDTPSAGSHTYSISTDNGSGGTSSYVHISHVQLLVIEL